MKYYKMKLSYLIALCLLLLTEASRSQPACPSGGRIQTPVVSKVAELQTAVNSTCDMLTISWQADKEQSYLITGVYTDETTGKVSAIENSLPISSRSNCSVQLAIKPGSSLSWTVQAIQEIDGRTFYSYPVRGETVGCEKGLIIKTTESSKSKPANDVVAEKLVLKQGLAVYPNPTSGQLMINWGGEYKGKAQLSIKDASGRAVRTIDISKQQFNYLDQVTVSDLSAGVYIVHISMQNGKSINTRFVKN